MRVLLISTNRARSPQMAVPLGCCLVASAARQAGHTVRLLDLAFARFPVRAVSKALEHVRPEVIGLSIRNIDNGDAGGTRFYLPAVRRLVEVCRTLSPAAIVLGGAAVTASPLPVLNFVGGDYAVAGEGERAFPELLHAIAEGGDPLSIPGVAAYRQGRPVFTQPRLCGNLSVLPSPSTERWLNTALYRKRGAAMPVQTKRGCAFECSYCVYPRLDGEDIRLRRPEAVASDVMRAKRLGFRTIDFVDSVFNVPEAHATACCEAIARVKPGLALRSDSVSPRGCSISMVRAMSEAGFSTVGCAAGSGSDEILSALNKGYTSDHLRRAARHLRLMNAARTWVFTLGGPGETERTVADTARFLEQELTCHDLVYVSCGIRLMEGTPLHERAVAEGAISPEHDLLEPCFYFSPHLTPERAMAILTASRFPSRNIVKVSEGVSRLPILQWAEYLGGLKPSFPRCAPGWNRVCR